MACHSNWLCAPHPRLRILNEAAFRNRQNFFKILFARTTPKQFYSDAGHTEAFVRLYLPSGREYCLSSFDDKQLEVTLYEKKKLLVMWLQLDDGTYFSIP